MSGPAPAVTLKVLVLLAFGIVVSAGCPKRAPETAGPAPDLDVQMAARLIAKDLASQIGPGTDRTVVIDPLLDRTSGQQTGVSVRLEQEIRTALGEVLRGAVIVPFDPAGAAKARYVITGNVASVTPPDQHSLSASMTDRQSGLVVAQSAARFRQAGLDPTPTRFYSDSASDTRDRSVDGYLTTSETPAGRRADPLYVEQVPTAAMLADALAAYNRGEWELALTRYGAAAARPDGQQLRSFNGLYLSNLKLGRMEAAEEAFGRIAALGLATNNLAVKLLFRPGATDFSSETSLSGVYPMWLRQIGRAARTSGSCLHIIGHTSRTGSEAVNDALSLERARRVRDLLEQQVPGLAKQSRVSGVGFHQNLIGTGADDASDALDRRVEFEVEPCPR